MKKISFVAAALLMVAGAVQAQNFKETFDFNSLGWTECASESDSGTAIIDNGVLTITSKGEKKGLSALMSVASGTNVQVGKNTFFETHCYAPIDVEKPFAINTDVTIEKLAPERNCGLVFNYRDGGNFYAFTFNDEIVTFLRYENGDIVGSISQGVRWGKKSKLNQQWRLVSEGGMLTFFVDDMEVIKVRYMPLQYAGVGFYTFGKQKLVVDDIEFVQM